MKKERQMPKDEDGRTFKWRKIQEGLYEKVYIEGKKKKPKKKKKKTKPLYSDPCYLGGMGGRHF